MLYVPSAVVTDSSGNLYVADKHNNRVSKYSSTGAFQGWMGKILTSPTGGAAGCSGAAVYSVTPGWCTGGTAVSGTGVGQFTNPSAVGIDASGHLFVTDYSSLQRFF
jgi:DNA-binding beta-propeller fold protein YncE